MTGYNKYSRESYGSRRSSNQYGDDYGDSRRDYNDYNNDYRNDYRDEGRYADNRRLIGDTGDDYPSQKNPNNRYDDLIDSRRNTNRLSDSLGSTRQDPYDRMGGYNDNYDGEYRTNNRSSRKNTDSRNPYNDDTDPYDDGRPKSGSHKACRTLDDLMDYYDDGGPKKSGHYNTDRDRTDLYGGGSGGGASHSYNSNKSSRKDTDNHPDNRYAGSRRDRSPGDKYKYGSRYRDGRKSFDEVNAEYGYAMRDDDAGRRYKPESEDGWVDDGRPRPGERDHRDRYYY